VDDHVGVLVSAAVLLSALHCGEPAPQVLYHNKLESLDGLLTRDVSWPSALCESDWSCVSRDALHYLR
jgi:hypothetical protein